MDATTDASMETTTEPSWWQKNRRWVIPVGIGGVLLVCITAIFCVVSPFLLIFNIIKSSDVYTESLARAQVDPQVIEVLGEPIEDGWFVSGNINIEGSSGNADFAIPISGPKNSGTIYVVAFKEVGRWHYTVLEVDIDGQSERIDLNRE